MSAPNLVNPSSVIGTTVVLNLTTTALSQLLNNAASSSTALKINSLIVANTNGVSSATITLALYSAATLGGTANEICKTISVLPGSSLIVIDKTTTFYLMEDKSLGVTADTANYLKITCSYELIS